MRPSEIVAKIVGSGNSLAIPLALLRALEGDYPTAALATQLLYWHGKMGREFYKSDEELGEEICLSPYQLRRAREALAPLGFLSRRKGIPAKMHYRVDYDLLDKFLAEWLNSSEKTPELVEREPSELIQKTTQETTQETTKEKHTSTDVDETALFENLPKPKDPKKVERERLDGLREIYNANRGTLAEATKLTTFREKKLRALVRELGDEAEEILRDATRAVVAAGFYAERGYTLDNLLRDSRYVAYAEAWRADGDSFDDLLDTRKNLRSSSAPLPPSPLREES